MLREVQSSTCLGSSSIWKWLVIHVDLTIQSWRESRILMVAKHLFFSSIQTLSCNVKTYLTFFVFKDNFYNCEKRPLLKSVGNFTEVSGIISEHFLMRKIWCFDSRLSEKNRFFRCLQGKEMQVENCDNLSNIYSDSTEFVN